MRVCLNTQITPSVLFRHMYHIFQVTIDHINGFVHCPHFSIHRVLKIPWSSVTKCEMCLEPSEPALYLTLSSGALPTLREQFQMVKGKWPYYDPQGGDGEFI